jgi:hypothetical protein
VPVAEFAAAICLSSKESLDLDEVECLLANMIYKVRLIIRIQTSSPDDGDMWRTLRSLPCLVVIFRLLHMPDAAL